MIIASSLEISMYTASVLTAVHHVTALEEARWHSIMWTVQRNLGARKEHLTQNSVRPDTACRLMQKVFASSTRDRLLGDNNINSIGMSLPHPWHPCKYVLNLCCHKTVVAHNRKPSKCLSSC